MSSKIWVVDDERSIRWVLEKALTQSGLSVSCYADGSSLLSRLEEYQPDVILSDIRMPGIDGIELLENIKDKYPDLPVIIMTAHSDLDSHVSSFKSGAFDYIPKPFEVDEAVAIVKRALAQRQESKVGAEKASNYHGDGKSGWPYRADEGFRTGLLCGRSG